MTLKIIRIVESIIIFLLPILMYYEINTIGITTILAIILFVLILFDRIFVDRKNNLFKNNKKYILIYMIYFIMLSFINKFIDSYSVNLGNIFMIAIIISLIFIFQNFENSNDIFIKTYKVFCTIILIYLCIQMIFYYGFNVILSGKIPFLELGEGYNLNNHTFGVSVSTYYTSFSSFFSERSHLVLYCAPFLCIILFDHKKGYLIKSIFISLLLCFTFSGNGIMIVMIIWLLFFISIKSIKNKSKFILLLFGLIIMVAFYMFLKNNKSFSSVLNNLFVSESGNNDSKADYRIYRGFNIFLSMPADKMIFGIGYKNLISFSDWYGLTSKYETNKEYLNSIAQILIYTGIIGFIPFLIFFVKEFMNKCLKKRVLLIVFLLFSLSSSIFLEGTWLIYMILITGIKNVQKRVMINQKRVENQLKVPDIMIQE